MTDPDPERLLGQAFASRAEQLRERVFNLYQEPFYFPELLDPRSCVLIGGRGTGKTTVLRGLSYQGRDSLTSGATPLEWDYYGVYVRINTARVTAFRGSGLAEDAWTQLFGHYLNILLCEAALKFLRWFEHATGVPTVGPADCRRVARGFGCSEGVGGDLASLAAVLDDARTDLELFVNNAADGHRPVLSILGGPLDTMMAAVANVDALSGRAFFFLLDEYENLSQHQQRIANTLVKHAGELYSFKIGVKELGWRSRMTLNEHEQLQAPADYAQFDISGRLRESGVFREFAARICNDRLDFIAGQMGARRLNIDELLPALSEDEEADLLGIRERTDEIRRELLEHLTLTETAVFDGLVPLNQYLFAFWAAGHGASTLDCFRDFLLRPGPWETRYGNYKHALLFTLRAGRRGIRKHYAGFDTYVELAGANLRFLVQLVEEALRSHLREASEPVGRRWLVDPVPPERQTTAARVVGARNLRELEGLSLIGPRLTRLCVGLGRVFQIMAAKPEGHAPEVTQFRIADGTDYGFDQGHEMSDSGDWAGGQTVEGRRLIAEAIMHLALIRFPGTKLSGTHTAEDDYMLHPVFAPVFDYSYRRKRKMSLSEVEIIGLVTGPPGKTIAAILARSGRELDPGQDVLPDQMYLFDQYLRSDG